MGVSIAVDLSLDVFPKRDFYMAPPLSSIQEKKESTPDLEVKF